MRRRRIFLRKDVIHALGSNIDPYLTRWTILEIAGWSLKLHRFHRSDDDRDLHDHPWTFWSLILWGGYWEHLPLMPFMLGFPDSPESRMTERYWRRPLSLLRRPAPWPHRVELKCGTEGKVWTLVLTKPKTRQWGFYTVCGWIPFPRYARAKTEGC